MKWVEDASRYRNGHVKALALTGGEPFYNLKNLSQISAYGKTLGLVVSVVTNAFWASTREKALDILANLPSIQMLSFSTDVYHQQAISLDKIKNAIWAAQELGRFYNIAVCTDNEENPEYQRTLEDLKAIGEENKIRVSITFPAGRAKEEVNCSSYRTGYEPATSACPVASSPVVFPDGKVIACIGPLLTLSYKHPMFLGNLYQESFSEIFDRAELNPVLHTIRVWGPHKLVSLLRQSGQDDLLPKEYIRDSACDVCYKLLSDARIIDALENISREEQLKQTVAYARLYYLNEATMAEMFHMVDT
jgi:MoaA/NifB/PqqE/SkfB family radical SAM enzyme